MPWMLLLTLFAAVVPPLTDAQRTQLATAEDGSALVDEGAWYPLIENALTWGPPPEPDYAALLAAPGDYRGDLFLIEGRFARARRTPLQRAGPWGDALTEWVILVERPESGPDRVAVVFFVDPEGDLPTPKVGRRVRATARFYKLWGDQDMAGEPTTYPTFVGRQAEVIAPPPTARTAADWGIEVVIVVFFLLFAGFITLRIVIGRRPSRTRERDEPAPGRVPPTDEELDDQAAALPEDPADALDELGRRD